MKIAVISDLHLGNGGRVDEFGHDEQHFLRFLDHLEDNFERIVLLGDVYETLYCPRPRGQVKELRRCKEAHSAIATRFDDRPHYRYLHGNHDIVAANVDKAPDTLQIDADGTRIVFAHGHQFDFVTKHLRRFSELVAWVGAWAFRAGLRPLRHVVEWLETKIRGESTVPEQDRFQLAALSAAEYHEADIVVTGHTHSGGVVPHGERLFMNSGSCAGGDFSFLTLDTARGEFTHQTAW